MKVSLLDMIETATIFMLPELKTVRRTMTFRCHTEKYLFEEIMMKLSFSSLQMSLKMDPDYSYSFVVSG